MVCGGEAVKPAGYVVLEGPQGRVAVKDDNGNGVFDKGDEIYAVAEGSGEVVHTQKSGDEDEVKERLKAMVGLKEVPFGTSLKSLKDYVTHLQDARKLAVGNLVATEDDVVGKLILADEAAVSAGIPVDDDLQDEILKSWEASRTYYDSISLGKLGSLPYFDEKGDYVEERIDEAAEVARKAGIPDKYIEMGAQRLRYELSQQRIISALALAKEGKMDEAGKLLDEGKSFADMGGFEETYEAMLKEEYDSLISVDALYLMSFIEAERTFDTAALFAKKADIPPEKVEKDTHNSRYELCFKHYADATRLVKEGKIKEARLSKEKADSFSDMGDFDEIFKLTSVNIDKSLADLEKAKELPMVAEKKIRGLEGLLDKIEGTLNNLPHPVLKGTVTSVQKGK